jgi:integral membrane protein (TIGR01906 family)
VRATIGGVTTARATAVLSAGDRRRSRLRSLPLVLLPPATAVAVLGVGLLVLLSPFYIHAALDMAGAPARLGISPTETHAASDRTVGELLFGPATFAFAGPDGRPFYDPAEAAHMRDVRSVLFGFLGLAALGGALFAIGLARGWREPSAWRAVAGGGLALAFVLVVMGAFAWLAFEVAFEFFHVLLFPAGNWAFDPSAQRLVQLYPLAFWQLSAAALGVIGVSGGLALWLIGRRRARALQMDG